MTDPKYPTEPGIYFDAKGLECFLDRIGTWRGRYGDPINPTLLPLPLTKVTAPRFIFDATTLDALPPGSLIVINDETYQRRHDNARTGERTWLCLNEAIDWRDHESYSAANLLTWTVPASTVLVVYVPVPTA